MNDFPHEHTEECASFCSAAIPPERSDAYEWAMNPYGPSCNMHPCAVEPDYPWASDDSCFADAADDYQRYGF